MPPHPRIGLVGPDRTQPCGIADFTERLAAALGAQCDLVFVPFRDALGSSALEGCQGILVQYERSLVPSPDFMPRLGARHPGRVYAVPHEVYREDPFAFPFASLRSAFPPLLWLKRAAWRLRHREYAREQRLQAAGYGAHRVIPLSGPGTDILRALAPGKVLDPVPHPLHVPPEGGRAPARDSLFPSSPRAVLGIFGFLNPGLDYAQAFDLLAGLDAGACLLLLGGDRENGSLRASLEAEAAGRGLADRVRISGWIPPGDVGAWLGLCDLFLAPMRFKSNSGALLHLFRLGRPILAQDLPLTRWLVTQGAPLDLYADAASLRSAVSGYLAGAAAPPANRYAWDFPAAARAYLRAMGAATAQ